MGPFFARRWHSRSGQRQPHRQQQYMPYNDIGIQVAHAGNIIIKNSRRGGTTPIASPTGNSMGQEIKSSMPAQPPSLTTPTVGKFSY
jgi:hypothetical protein